MSEELCNLGVFDLARLYRRGEVSPVEVVGAHLQRCERLNSVLNAFLVLLKDSAMESARAMEGLFRAGVDLGPLQGVPVSMKDLIRMRGTRTTAGSRVLLQEPLDQNDAAIVRHFRAAGAVIIGKTNLHEFASGDPDPAGPFGWVQNPRRIGCNPGLSSSGAGAAATSGLGVIAIGTDTGGSIRIPSSLCGLAGLKPTTGRISMGGIIPLSWTLDTVGPLARRVSDVAAAMAVLARPMHEPANDPLGTHLADQLAQPVRNWRIGVPQGKYFEKVQPAVSLALENTLKHLRALGCQLIDCAAPQVESMADLTTVITQVEGSAYHERHREQENLYGPNFRERIFPGREIKAVTYLAARGRQMEIQQEWLSLVKDLDVLIVPTCPVVAPPHGVATLEVGGESFPTRPLLSRFTRPFSLLGWPALSIPNGLDGEGLPTGVQITGPPDCEMRLLTFGHQLEQALGLAPTLGIELPGKEEKL
jgi:aspartyl-tRNA(Asn)/glutamyl-tRNA(Gln) amidotransferase subunit A